MHKLLALLILLPVGCSDPEGPAPLPYMSPAGYGYGFMDFGSAALYPIGDLLDAAIEDAAIELWKYGVEAGSVYDACRKLRVTIVDHFRFETAWSPTGYATGLYNPSLGSIMVTLYSRAYGDHGPAWTVVWWGERWQCGEIPKALPALAHELGHHFFGGAFEHGWTPPVVNGRAMASSRAPFDPSLCARPY